jgi:hypothetical protein
MPIGSGHRKPELKILHLSDLHLSHDDYCNDRGLTKKGHTLHGIIGSIVKQHEPQVVVLSGDFLFQATPLPEAAIDHLKDLFPEGIPVVAVPGNHDVKLDVSYKNAAERFAPYLDFARRFYQPKDYVPNQSDPHPYMGGASYFRPFPQDPLGITGVWNVTSTASPVQCRLYTLNSVCRIPDQKSVESRIFEMVGGVGDEAAKERLRPLVNGLASKSAWIYFPRKQVDDLIQTMTAEANPNSLAVIVSHNAFVEENSTDIVAAFSGENRESASEWYSPAELMQKLSMHTGKNQTRYAAFLLLHGDLHEERRDVRLFSYGKGTPIYILGAGATWKTHAFEPATYYLLSIYRRTSHSVLDIVVESYAIRQNQTSQMKCESTFSIDLGITGDPNRSAAPFDVYPRVATSRYASDHSRHQLLQTFISSIQAHTINTFGRLVDALLVYKRAHVVADELYDWVYPGFWQVFLPSRYRLFATHRGDFNKWRQQDLTRRQNQFILNGGSVFRVLTFDRMDDSVQASRVLEMQRNCLYSNSKGRLVIACKSYDDFRNELQTIKDASLRRELDSSPDVRRPGPLESVTDLYNAALLVDLETNERLGLYFVKPDEARQGVAEDLHITIDAQDLAHLSCLETWFEWTLGTQSQRPRRAEWLASSSQPSGRPQVDLFYDSDAPLARNGQAM